MEIDIVPKEELLEGVYGGKYAPLYAALDEISYGDDGVWIELRSQGAKARLAELQGLRYACRRWSRAHARAYQTRQILCDGKPYLQVTLGPHVE